MKNNIISCFYTSCFVTLMNILFSRGENRPDITSISYLLKTTFLFFLSVAAVTIIYLFFPGE